MSDQTDKFDVPRSHIKNATVSSVKLGFDRGCIMTAWVHLKGSGWGCEYGGYALDAPGEDIGDSRRGTAYGCQKLRELLDFFEVDRFRDIEGKSVRVVFPDECGLGQRCKGLIHFTDDRKQFVWESCEIDCNSVVQPDVAGESWDALAKASKVIEQELEHIDDCDNTLEGVLDDVNSAIESLTPYIDEGGDQ